MLGNNESVHPFHCDNEMGTTDEKVDDKKSFKVKSNLEKVSVFAKKTFFAFWNRILFEHPLPLKFRIKTLKISLNSWKSEQTLAIRIICETKTLKTFYDDIT